MKLELMIGSRRLYLAAGADRVGRWGKRRFEVWRVDANGRLLSFHPEDSARKLTRREAWRTRIGAVKPGERIEAVDLASGQHELVRVGV